MKFAPLTLARACLCPKPSNRPTRSRLRGSARNGVAAGALVLLTGCASLSGNEVAEAPPATPVASGPTAQAAQESPAPQSTPRVPLRRSVGAHGAEPEVYDALPEFELTPQILYQLLASEVAAQRGELGSATATYLNLARQTRDPRIARRATELALADRSLPNALQGARLWRELAPESDLAAQTLESLWIASGRLESVEPLLAERLADARAAGELPIAYPRLLRSLLQAPDRGATLALFDRLAAPDRSVVEARIAAATLAERAGKLERAAAEARAALELRPDDTTIAVTAARYTMQSPGGAPAAATLLDDFLRANPDAIEARYAYARLLAAQNRPEEARLQMEKALEQAPDNPAVLFSLAQIAYQTKQLDVARTYLQAYLDLPESNQRDSNQAWLFLAQLEEDQDRPEKAIEWLSRIDSGDSYLPARVRRALLMGKLGKVSQARALLQVTTANSARDRSLLASAEAQLLREAGQPKEAFTVLERALEASPDNPELLYDHAMAAERLDRIDVAETSLRRVIELRPDNAHAYNALGYTLADRNLRLDEAQTLIEKALEIAPDDPHIVDSLGWVLYRRGKLQEAIVQLRRAWGIKPDVEIGVHLGEVLWKAGQFDEARKFWREARALEPGNETLRQTLARFDVSL